MVHTWSCPSSQHTVFCAWAIRLLRRAAWLNAAYLPLPISAYLFRSFHLEWMGKSVTRLNLLRWDTNLAKMAPRRPKVALRRRQKRGAR
ncbi:hypothetical protein SAMN04487824_12710 [Parafannyhessea umbonata]|uniref:Uncharacterized protein n=1 Tax=Parafannyhessea umbonata TaxID=604330 RepID=A0A1G6N003_9ACTN|nr:hypothetical protein SAMN04487824_12710 [Parafannyhessea umbonata]